MTVGAQAPSAAPRRHREVVAVLAFGVAPSVPGDAVDIESAPVLIPIIRETSLGRL